MGYKEESNYVKGIYGRYQLFGVIMIALIVAVIFSLLSYQMISLYPSIKTIGYSINKGINNPQLSPVLLISFVIILFFIYALVSDAILKLGG